MTDDDTPHLATPEDDDDHNGSPKLSNSAGAVTSKQIHVSHTANLRSCVTCRRRKVRCDKMHPCANCTRAHIECVFPAPGRAPRKSKKLGDGRDKELLERLRRLEGVVKDLGADVPSHVDLKR